MDAGRLHFLGSQRVELKARPFFLLALRACRPCVVSFFKNWVLRAAQVKTVIFEQ